MRRDVRGGPRSAGAAAGAAAAAVRSVVRSVVICGAPHGSADLAEAGTAGSDPGAQGAGLVEFAEEGGAAAQPIELFGCLAGGLGHGGTIQGRFGTGARGGAN